MTDDGPKWTMKTEGIATYDPKVVTRFLCKHYLVMRSKASRDQLAEFCHLVVLLDLKDQSIPQPLRDLVNGVMEDPQRGQLEEAISKLKDYAYFLPSDPRKASTDVAKAWQKSEKIREGKAVEKFDESPPSQPENSDWISKDEIPIQVQVWSPTQSKLDPASEIRCAVPSLSMVGNLQNIIRYAATAGFNFPLRDGERRSRPEKVNLNSQAMLFSMSLDLEWVLRDKSTTLGGVVKHSHRLQIVNTKLKNLAVAVAVRSPPKFLEHFIFDIKKPQDLVSTLRGAASETQVLRCIAANNSNFLETRFLKIQPEEVAMQSAASSNHGPKIHSSTNPSHGVPPSNSFKSDSPPAAPQMVHPQRQPPSAKARPPENVGSQALPDHRIEDLRSPSPASSYYSVAPEEAEPPHSEVHHDSKTRHPARGTPSAPSTNPMSAVSASSSSSTVMVDKSVAQSAIPSKPPQTPPTTDTPAQKKGSDSFYRRVLKKIGW